MTTLDYSWVLAISYAVAFAVGIPVFRRWAGFWPEPDVRIERPWREIGLLFASFAGVIAVGWIYQAGWLLPRSSRTEAITESVNQTLIFLPFLLMMRATGQGRHSLWLRTDRVHLRLLVGLAFGALAALVFTSLHRDADGWLTVLARVYHPGNTHFAVQVLLEDLAIAALFVRASAVIGVRPAIVLTGALFAAGHVPAMVASGEWFGSETWGLLRDAALVVLALSVLRRAADVWFMWVVHYTMDMMQYYSGATLP